MPRRLLCLAAILWCLGGSTEAADPAVRVLCYNVHHGEGADGKIDLPRLAAVIRAADPDLVALQEVDNRTRRSGGVDQAAELARLSGLHGAFGKQIDFEGGGYGQAVLSKLPVGRGTVHVLPGEPAREQRIAFAVPVTLAAGQEVTFVTAHLHHINGEFRERQATRLNELFADARRPAILAGDLNAAPDSRPVAVLASLWDVATVGKEFFTYPAGKPTKQLDYVMTRPAGRFRVAEARVVEEPVASDHRPVLVVLEWRTPSR